MDFIKDFKFGALEGTAGLAVVILLAVSAFALLLVLCINGAKVLKERRDRKEEQLEDEYYKEYGVTSEELYLNEKLTGMRNQLKDYKPGEKDDDIPAPAPVEQAPVEPTPVEEPKKEEPAPVVEEPKKEEPAPVEPAPVEPTPVEEPKKEEPAPVVEEPKKEEPAPIAQPVKEEAKVAEPVSEPVKDEKKPEKADELKDAQQKQGVAKPTTKKIVKKKPDDWSKYDGEYEGYYYDPEDACYYEGTPSPELAKKLAAKQAELEAANANKDKKVVIKKVAPPFAALKTPKNPRKEPKKIAGFDESVIYGKYIIEHADKPDGTQEYFYTLYDAKGTAIYESSNYTSLEYVKRAITRFKTHAIVGQFTIEAEGGKFFFVLKRKSYTHKGMPHATFDEANNDMRQIKAFYATDIIREQ